MVQQAPVKLITVGLIRSVSGSVLWKKAPTT